MKDFRNKGFMMSEESRSKITESYRSLRTNIGMCSLDAPPKSLMVTSSVPQEGKTTTVINMGISFSQIGLKVLLIDTDLRNPMIHTFFDLDRDHGLTNALISIYGTNLKSGKIKNQRDCVSNSQLSLYDLFHIIQVRGKTGTLTIKTDKSAYLIKFQNGILVDANTSGDRGDNFLLKIISDAKHLSADQVKDLKKRSRDTGRSIEFVSLNMRLIDKKELEGFIRLKISKIVKDIFSLPEVGFTFEGIKELIAFQPALPMEQDNEFQSESSLAETPYVNHVIKEHVKPTPVENLFVLPCGTLPQNPAELLSSQSFRVFIKKLTEVFDMVIFDTPPVTAVTDPSLIAPLVDGVILVVRNKEVDQSVVCYVKDQLVKSKANILGVVLNRLDSASSEYYYKYGYGKYYGKEYGECYGRGSQPGNYKKIDVV